MQTETYEQLETREDGHLENQDQSYVERLQLLGLAGQIDRIPTAGTNAIGLPFVAMRRNEQAIYQTLFPNKVEITEYRTGPIPERVLDLVDKYKSAIDNDDMWELHVWHNEDIADPDPLLVATHFAEQSWGKTPVDHYLMARWGDALAPLDVLEQRANESILDTWREQIADARSQLDQFEARMGREANNFVKRGQNVWASSVTLKSLTL